MPVVEIVSAHLPSIVSLLSIFFITEMILSSLYGLQHFTVPKAAVGIYIYILDHLLFTLFSLSLLSEMCAGH